MLDDWIWRLLSRDWVGAKPLLVIKQLSLLCRLQACKVDLLSLFTLTSACDKLLLNTITFDPSRMPGEGWEVTSHISLVLIGSRRRNLSIMHWGKRLSFFLWRAIGKFWLSIYVWRTLLLQMKCRGGLKSVIASILIITHASQLIVSLWGEIYSLVEINEMIWVKSHAFTINGILK